MLRLMKAVAVAMTLLIFVLMTLVFRTILMSLLMKPSSMMMTFLILRERWLAWVLVPSMMMSRDGQKKAITTLGAQRATQSTIAARRSCVCSSRFVLKEY